jgi:hypothetical protein
MSAYERLLLPENLNFAWQKAKRLYRMSDGYINHSEIAEFELNLEFEFKRIRKQFKKGIYRPKAIRALPRPKKMKEGKPINRQFFHVAVVDQVAWIAVANALGPELDQRMPSWSYGNRLYRPAWYEDGDGQQSKLEVGPYRHASGHLYRKFQHSWPLFRRHVALTARSMVRPLKRNDLDVADQLAVASAEAEGLPYLNAAFWSEGAKKKNTDLHYASVDLKQFYPSIKSNAVLTGLFPTEAESTERDEMRELLKSMLRFPLDRTDVPEATMDLVEPRISGRHQEGIPTGLLVAGFLANVAMLPIDEVVNKRIEKERAIAHFRFVDDHTILAYNFDQLCDWIDWYKGLLKEREIGPEVNEEKYDPESLAQWMSIRADIRASERPSKQPNGEKEKQDAIDDTRIDGANPTKLLTKTLGQVSAIAVTNANLLDDKDLEERLKLLEWLLLADIPERELRPDTRAAFAAGQIAKLAPILVQEIDGLVDGARALTLLKSQAPNPDTATREAIELYRARLSDKANEVATLQANYDEGEGRWLRHCFGLLIQAFTEFPSKPRLFYRLHQYCRLTGHPGLPAVADWIRRTRDQGHISWADYYCGLTLQILANGILQAVQTITNAAGLRSDRVAALRHLEDVASIDVSVFSVPQERQAWFHVVGKREFAVSTMSAAEALKEHGEFDELIQRLRAISACYVTISFENSSDDWEAQTGRRPGVWAHLVEPTLSVDARPSRTWRGFESCFDYRTVADRRAARRYPESLSDKGWAHFLQSKRPRRESDSGWVRDALGDDQRRKAEARSSRYKSFTRAARNLDPPSEMWLSVAEWTQFIKQECSAFDPRRSEWTALEIVNQFVAPIVGQLGPQKRLDLVHPNNILVPRSWRTKFEAGTNSEIISWEAWRSFLAAEKSDGKTVDMRRPADSIVDYRYFNYTQRGSIPDIWERRLTAIGRLLLGLLRYEHEALRIWNIRGNERVVRLPLAIMFRSLAISSPTLLLLEGCLSGRSAETRTIARQPGLFGWPDGSAANDVRFDPPPLRNPNELLVAIKRAQDVLVENQLAVSMNQPRQLIPFRLSDFATGLVRNGEEDA